MRGRSAALAIVLGLASGPAGAAAPLLGEWARGDGKARVRIEPCGDALCAVNSWVRPGTAGERIGDRLVMTLAPDGGSRLQGKAWDPQRRLNYSLRVEVGERTMSTRGCLVAGLLCAEMGWSRVAP